MVFLQRSRKIPRESEFMKCCKWESKESDGAMGRRCYSRSTRDVLKGVKSHRSVLPMASVKSPWGLESEVLPLQGDTGAPAALFLPGLEPIKSKNVP